MSATRKRIRRSVRAAASRLAFGTTAHALERVYVRPETLTNYPAVSVRVAQYGRIRFGCWDTPGRPCHQYWRMRCCHLHWCDGQSWEESGAYAHLAAEVARSPGGVLDGCRTHDDIVRRYERLDALHEVAKRQGLASLGVWTGDRVIERDAIVVHLARDGQLLVGAAGAHRLAMAQCLGLTWIPAGLGLVHGMAARQLRYRRSDAARSETWYIG